ncbi:DUF6942 family protein [Aliikangiella sp. IMCC44632]
MKPARIAAIGDPMAHLIVYNANRPPLLRFSQLTAIEPLLAGDIANIGQACGNHWKKIFNCYAKLAFELQSSEFPNWQSLRDNRLLQQNSRHQLVFSAPSTQMIQKHAAAQNIQIICGKQYFSQLNLALPFEWINPNFAISPANLTIVAPYFDYRQLSNLKISYLSQLIHELKPHS